MIDNDNNGGPNGDLPRWGDALESTDYFKLETQVIAGHEVFCGSTKYGDGSYLGYGHEGSAEFPVDAGLIGIMSMALVEAYGTQESASDNGEIVEFEEDFDCEIEDGLFKFGDWEIDTRCNDEEDEPDDFQRELEAEAKMMAKIRDENID